jgi:hypothetical protein
VAGCRKHGNIPSDSIKDEEFIDYLSGYLLLKEDSAQVRLYSSTIPVV